MLLTVLGMGIVVSAALTISTASGPHRRWHYLFKPLTITLILGGVLASPRLDANGYAPLVAAGLVFSLVGDIFVMLPDNYFAGALFSFLVAHICYIAAFTNRAGVGESPWLGLPFLAVALAITVLVASRARGLRWPGTVYAFVVVAMAWRAWAVWASAGGWLALLAGVGALLFVVSDTLLATDRFVRRFRGATTAVLITYYAAQTLIAWSV